jgi:hypothetical protein
MAKGVSAQQLQQTLQKANINPTPTTDQAPQESWWKKLLPIAGGIGATLLAPETMGASLLGGAALFGAGTAAGKVGENAITGKPLGEDVVSNALTSGATGLAGGALMKGAGSVLGGIVGKSAAEGTGGVVSNAANKVGSSLFQGQFDKTLGKTASQDLYNLGIRTDKEVGQLVPFITGKTGAYPTAIKQGLAEAENAGHVVNLEGITSTAAKELENHLNVNDNVISKIGSTVTNAINNTAKGDVKYVPGLNSKAGTFIYTPGTLANANPTTVFEQAQKLERIGNTALKNATDTFGNVTNDNNYAIGKTLTATARDLVDRVMTSSGAQIPLSDTVKQSLISNLAQVKNINPTVYDNLVKQLPDNISGLRAPQSAFVQGSQALRAMESAQETSGGLKTKDLFKASSIPATIGGGMVAGPVGAVGGALLPILAGSNVTERLGTQLMGKLGSLGANSAEGKVASKILPRAMRAGTIAGGTAGSLLSATPPQNANINTGATMNPTQTNPNSLASILANYQGMGAMDPYLLPSTAPVVSALAPLVQKQELVAPSVENILSTFANAGGAQGTGGGLLSRLTGLIPGTPANTYGKAASTAAAQLAALLGISPEQAQGMLPQLMHTGATAAPQVGALQSILGILGSSPSAIPAQ